MNVQEYIASGILEQYVLGALSERESAEVLRNATNHLEIRAEINALEDALMQYAQANAIPLREGLTEDILSTIDKLDANQAVDNTTATTTKPNNSSWLSGLLGTLLIGAMGLSFYFYQQKNQVAQQLNTTETTLVTQKENCTKIEQRAANLAYKLNILRTAGNRTTTMAKEDSETIAFVHANPDGQIAYLDVEQLPTPPEGKQYQLWYISDGAPQSMGVFDLSDDFIEVAFVETAEFFAISLEPAGGSPEPTTNPFIGPV